MNLELLKKRWYYFAPVILVLVPLLLMVYFSMTYGYSMGEAWKVVRHMGQSGTRFPVKYEERNFDKLRPGMDGRTVYQTMSVQPFEGQGGTDWKYSLPQDHAPYYHERLVIMEPDKNGVPRVKQVIKRFHEPAAK